MDKQTKKHYQDFIRDLLINQIIVIDAKKKRVSTQQNIVKRAEWLMHKHIKSDLILRRLYFSARRYILEMRYNKALNS